MCFLWLKIPISRYPPWLLFYLFVPFTQMLLSPPQLPWFLLLKLNETPSLLFLLCFSSQNLSVEKLGKTTRPFRYDLNQISYDYTVEVTNRFKVLDLIDRVPEELWTVHDIVQQAVIKNIPKRKKCKMGKWLSREALQIAEKRREAKITTDGDCSHEIKRCLLLGRKAMKLDSILKSRDITLPTMVRLVKAMVFPVAM